MKLSSDTLNILKNFGAINQGIMFKKGKTLKTVSPHKNILVQAQVAEEIPVDFGIYDLPQLLSNFSLFTDTPSLVFGQKEMKISDGNSDAGEVTFRYCEPTMIVLPPEKEINMPDAEVNLEITSDVFNKFMRAANNLSAPHIVIKSDGVKVTMEAVDLQNDSAHTFSIKLGDGNGDMYQIVFKTENISKVLMGSYDFSYSAKGVSSFKNKNSELKYWITSETGSSYSKK